MVQVGGRVGGGEPSPAGAHLQPEEPAFSVDPAELARLHEDGFAADERDEADAARERLERLLHDAIMVERLRAQDFRGTDYELFAAALASYGLPVTRAWIRRGEIFGLSARRGRSVGATLEMRQHLSSAAAADDRQELAMETVAVALSRFRQDALLNGRWNIDGGASLNTFFAGACILAFPNVFRAWTTTEYEPRRQLRHGDPLDAYRDGLWADTDPGVDPAAVAVRNDVLASALDLATDERVRQAVGELALTAPEYTEIAARVGMTEDALKQAMSRYRRRTRAARKEIAGE